MDTSNPYAPPRRNRSASPAGLASLAGLPLKTVQDLSIDARNTRAIAVLAGVMTMVFLLAIAGLGTLAVKTLVHAQHPWQNAGFVDLVRTVVTSMAFSVVMAISWWMYGMRPAWAKPVMTLFARWEVGILKMRRTPLPVYLLLFGPNRVSVADIEDELAARARSDTTG